MDSTRDFWEEDEDAKSTFCLLGTGLGSSSSAEVCLGVRRFRFPREGSPDTREPLADGREITGESVARLLDICDVRELLELLVAGLVGEDTVNMRGFLDFLGADATVNAHPSAERNQAHLDGYFSSSRASSLPRPR